MSDSTAPPPPRALSPFATSHLSRVLLIGFLILLLQIPLLMIREVIRERAMLRDRATAEIEASWGSRQTIEGPVLVVPYHVRVEEERDGKKVVRILTRHAHFLPEALDMNGELESETRYRGIFEVPVYLARVRFAGSFAKPDLGDWAASEADIRWDRAELVVHVSDARAIRNAVHLEWGEERFEFLPSAGSLGSAEGRSGFHVPLRRAARLTDAGIEFAFDLALQGSDGIRFAPFAKETSLSLESNWAAPSFQGAWLPSTRSIDETGFTATWKVPFLGRSFPQRWHDLGVVRPAIERSYFGVDFATMVDEYRMAERSAKYGMLFLALTFGSLWLFEVILGIRVHSIQYLLVGAGLCLFYLLEISLAEHLGFTLAYSVATIAVISVISAYCLTMLGSRKRAAAITTVLALLYGYLFVLLRDQEFALLAGSLGLFGALCAVMYLTRHVEWAAVGGGPEVPGGTERALEMRPSHDLT